MTELELEPRVYLVDDDEILLKAMTQVFELGDVDVTPISNPAELLSQVDVNFCGVVVTDVRMPEIDGLELFQRLQGIDADIPVIFITGHADVPMVLDALRKGAFDFFSKPIDSEHLLVSARKALETRRLVLENRKLKTLAQIATQGSELIGETPVMERLRATIAQVAQTEIDVLIEGETGTGKEVAARLLHKLSKRAARAFVDVNCAALPGELAETALFGAPQDTKLRGQITSIGKIESSHSGTLFLDEIESLGLGVQGQLLPIVESRSFSPAMGGKSKLLELRIIASSQIDLATACEQQTFRSDLYYRLNTVRLRMPPLRDRREDIPLLFAHFVTEAVQHYGKKAPNLNAPARRRLLEYDWPGNVRELKNFALSQVLGLDTGAGQSLGAQLSLPERMERFEANTIRATLEQTSGDVKESTESLGIPRKTFYDKLTRHDIDINQYRQRKSG